MPFSDLKRDFDRLRQNAATFRRVVLHLHSPDSHDGRWPHEQLSPPEAFRKALTDADLDLVAVTDHMRCGLACSLSASTTYPTPVILPGMEVNLVPPAPWSNWRLHVIVVFPQGYRLDQIAPCLPVAVRSVADDERTGQEQVVGIPIASFVRSVHACGGLCIAAHIDTDRGVRAAFRQLGEDSVTLWAPPTQTERQEVSDDFKPWLLGAGFDAIEVSQPDHKTHYRWRYDGSGTAVSIPVLLTSDAHDCDGLSNSERVTHVKMTENSFSGLRKALSFPDTRLRFPTELPDAPIPRIEGIQISSGAGSGFFEDLKLAFSDNLTCLIGPRGSGKSTIIEALRYVFGYTRSLGELEHEDGDLAQKTRSLQRATLSGSVIRVLYRTRGDDLHVLEATYSADEDYSTRVFSLDGEDRRVPDVETASDYPLRLFGWGELEVLGRDRARQRQLLDRLIPGLQSDLRRREELRTELAGKRQAVEQAADQLNNIFATDSQTIRRFTEFQAEFERLNTDAVKVLFEGLDSVRQKQRIVSDRLSSVRAWLGALGDVEDAGPAPSLLDLPEDAGPVMKEWWESTVQTLQLSAALQDLRAAIRSAVSDFTPKVTALEELGVQLQTEEEELTKEIRQALADDTQETVNAGLRQQASARLQRATQIRTDYCHAWRNFCAAFNEWLEASDELCAASHIVSQKRLQGTDEIEQRLNEFSTDSLNISLEFHPCGERLTFREALASGGLLTRDEHGSYRQGDLPRHISESFTPVSLAVWLAGLVAEEFTDTAYWSRRPCPANNLDPAIATRLQGSLRLCDYDSEAQVPVVDLERLRSVLRVADIPWDDAATIALNGTPVHEVSPGQRTSAMLPLTLLTQDVPLVIDQPEDNLDNRLIGLTLVGILARLKERRQIIVATHNPNIVVLGDAEQVAVLDAESAESGKILDQASIDSPNIVSAVIDIMEGGAEAFEMRRIRYGLRE